MIGRALVPEINELIQKRDFSTLKEVFDDWHPSELGETVADLNDKERAIVSRLLSKEKAADTFEYLDVDVQICQCGRTICHQFTSYERRIQHAHLVEVARSWNSFASSHGPIAHCG